MDKSDDGKKVEYDDSFERLSQYHSPRFQKSLQEALQDYTTSYVKTSHKHTPTAKAILMHCHIRDRVKRNFAGVPGAKIDERPGRAFKVLLDGAPIGIPGKAEFKCKKVDKRLLTANITTGAVKDFANQRPEIDRRAKRTPHVQQPLADWVDPKTTGGVEPGHGNVGYILNALGTGFERLCITYYTGLHSARLVLDLPIENANEAAEVVKLPLAEINEVAPRKRVVRRKTAEATQTEAKPKKERIKREVIESNLAKDKRAGRKQ